jgi:hypothetical protein
VSLTYRPGTVPRNLSQLTPFLQAEFGKLHKSFHEAQNYLHPRYVTAEPARPKAGMIVNADGTNWNPGRGPGLYVRDPDNREWISLGSRLDVKYFGARPGTTTDQSTYFHDAFDYAKENGIGSVFAEGTYYFTNNLVLRSGVFLESTNRAALVLRMDDCCVTHEIRSGLNPAARDTGLMATIEAVNGDEEVGLLIQGASYSDWDVKISDFNGANSTGMILRSGLDGSTYRYPIQNRIWDPEISDCYRGLTMTRDADDDAEFGANFNVVYQGYITGYTVTGVHVEYGEGNTFFSTRCTSPIDGQISWKIEDSVTVLIAPTGDGNLGGSVPGTLNSWGFPHGRDGDTTSIAFQFLQGSSGSVVITPRGDGCYNRFDFDTQTTMDNIFIAGRNQFNWLTDIRADEISARGKIGYETGVGGTVTQATSKAQAVTLNKITGEITTHNAALAADTTVSFTLNNTILESGDVLILNHVSGGTLGAYTLNAVCATDTATIYIRNITAGSLSEALVIRFAVIRGATS